jgi:ABC-type uncharacterized transport system substrate-binding protein
MIGRRHVLVGGTGLLFASVAPARAQRKTYRIGVLADIFSKEAFAAFQGRLAQLGYVAGTNLVFEHRRGQAEQLPTLAAELVRLKPDLMLANGPGSALALKRATTTIPVIFVAVEWDPVAIGLVASLVRTGGNATRLALLAPELGAKRLELLREILPRATRVAVLWQRIRAENQLRAVRDAAGPLKIQVIPLEIRDVPGELDEAMRKAAQERAEALLILGSPAFYPERHRLADLALKHRLPTSFQRAAYVEAGGLMGFGADIDGMYRRLGDYADRILKGTAPSELPVEQPAKFELVINRKTARALGLTLSPAVLARADRVIE